MNKLTVMALSLFAAANVNAAEINSVQTASNSDQSQAVTNAPKILIAYYSLSGNTKEVAEDIHNQIGGDLFEIQTVDSYPQEYRETTELAKKQINDGYKPALKGKIEDMSQYDVIFLGSPNWWGTIAPAVSSFLADYDLSGKIVVPFITHGGGGIQNTVKDMTAQCTGCKVAGEPWVGYGSRTMGISSWLEKLGYKK